ncbi:WD40 repeat-like protein [Westerdykella ornata]|uniref:WD40 repeat-like protein n=1 Tax=Westerdykella ornata TaxID=318751 RepID=A0A6A6JE90_WESOR|nr:WD40 repeat-like protein [Westerdykella ornata]KAF2274732.1 WD40 repeat-like protein [Westerdykella ornata]
MAGPISDADFATPSYLQAFRSVSSISKIDEGYSEDTRSQSGSDLVLRMDTRLGDGEDVGMDTHYPLPEWVLNMSESDRSEFAYAILRSLRTSSIAGIVEKLNPLLHLDPVLHLPPEITFHIFSYLSPETLLRASTLSKAWRARVMDSPLWRLLFRLEGWNSDFAQVRAFEEAERVRRANLKEKKTRPRTTEDTDSDKPSTKKRHCQKPSLLERTETDSSVRARMEPMSLDGSSDGPPNWAEQHHAVEADEGPSKADDAMEGVTYVSEPTGGVPLSPLESIRRKKTTTEIDEDVAATTPVISDALDPPVRPTLFLPSSTEPKINWQYLYKQKRRLEENWDMGRYTNFQLPHPDHPEERHTECVYTIQYSGKYLVSGSRDKTIRIWDLDTQRLVHPPLQEHTGSVLCLQFDERPEEDILITAGSDCRVILWQFSTGKLIKKIDQAHSESVLNLRFDDRYLVTCSKDKTIKVWNRKELWPTDDAYPSSTTRSKAQFPPYIINMQHITETSHLHFKPLQPYSLLMTMEGHGAAVNAIQIYDGQIVSASGDRNVKVWDVRTGVCLMTFPGHTKGIACVQFDGRRIVSGSSDETVRIFDRATGAEVACLQGHTNLVRTVQAQFGDLPGNEDELEAEARAVDRRFFEAKIKGLVPENLTRDRRRVRNAGSRDPRSILAYGAKLPPGGGGSKWARIVSGSYDETIIIWKKNADGIWEKSKVLYQNEAVRAAGGGRRRVPQNRNQGGVALQPNGTAATNFQALAHQAQAQAQAAHNLAQQASLLHAAAQTAQGQAGQHTNAGPTTQTGAPATMTGNPVNPIPPLGQQAPQVQQQPPQPPIPAAGAAAPVPQGLTPGQAAAAAAAAAGPHHHHHHHHHAHHLNQLNHPPTNSRVFKLQFDARRIICCSQDPTIVGWDFANGDRDIIVASRFFGESG